MARRSKLALVVLFLLPGLLLGTMPRASAQQVETTRANSDSSGDDPYAETILVGFAVIVVAVLVVLGIRSDRAWGSNAQGPEQFASAGEGIGLTTEKDERSIEWTGTGLRATF